MKISRIPIVFHYLYITDRSRYFVLLLRDYNGITTYMDMYVTELFSITIINYVYRVIIYTFRAFVATAYRDALALVLYSNEWNFHIHTYKCVCVCGFYGTNYVNNHRHIYTYK